jgi:hypothetical protein
MRQIKLMGMVLCVLLIAPVFSGILSEIIEETSGITGFHSPDKCVFSGVGINLNNQFMTPLIDLPGTGTSRLVFQTKYEIKSNSTDFGRVKISADNGNTWDTLQSFQGSQLDWTNKEIDLSSYSGETIKILFEYTTGPDFYHLLHEGWNIDRIIVEKDGMIPYSEYFEQYSLGTKLGDWTVVEKQSALDIEYITIGYGSNLGYSFAIFADPQIGEGGGDISRLQAAVDEVIAINNDVDPNNDIDFVIALGDLIQGEGKPPAWKGETEYRQEYEQAKSELDRLANSGIYYIPMIGNHDVWFKYPDIIGGYDHDGNPPDYPEELFADYFDAQYDILSQELVNWTDQRGSMPIDNPYDDSIPETFPDIYFQNFAFDYGPYHFICLDFCAREDFDPFEGVSVKKFWGYADLHDTDTSGNPITDGTWDWLENHLEYCEREGIKDVIIFTHHPPTYELDTIDPVDIRIPESPNFIPFSSSAEVEGEMHIVDDPNYRNNLPNFEEWNNKTIHNGTTVDRIEGDAVFGFNKFNYDEKDEYDKLANLFSSYDIDIVHWFSGHYHLKGFNWFDSNIRANISVIPSIMTAEDIYRINFTGQVKINELSHALVTLGENPNGCFTIVQVMSPEWSDWPMFHHNPQRTGKGKSSGIFTMNASLGWTFDTRAYDTDAKIIASPVVSKDGTIYAVSTSRSGGNVYALDPSGNLKSGWPFTNGAEISSTPAISPEISTYSPPIRLYVATEETNGPNFFALDPGTGNPIWSLSLRTVVSNDWVEKSSLVVIEENGRPVIYAASNKGYLYRIIDYGAVGDFDLSPWPLEISNDPIRQSPAVGPDGTIYIGVGSPGKLLAIEPDGDIREISLQGVSYFEQPAVQIVNGTTTIYVGTVGSPSRICAVEDPGINLALSLKWTYSVGGDIVSCPAVYDLNGDGNVEIIFGSRDNNVYAVSDVGTPQLYWVFQTFGDVVSSPAVAIAPQPTVFIGSNDNRIYSVCWDASSWGNWGASFFQTADDVTSSPAVAQLQTDLLGAPGMVFVGSNDGKLYAFGSPGRRSFDVKRINKDSDSDGVADEDQCYNPDCPLVDETGCPIDSDGDTVPDCEDECPDEAGTKEEKGCPEAGINGLFLVVLGIIVALRLTKFTE